MFKVGDRVRAVKSQNEYEIGKVSSYDGAPVYIFKGTGGLKFIGNQGLELIEDPADVDLVKIYKEAPKKYNTGKPMMSLIRPEFQLALAGALTYGYEKYGEKRGEIQNFLKGDGHYYSSIIDSLERHINAFKSGQNYDVGESELHHLSLAAANLMFLYTYETSDKGIDDRVVLDEKK